jgi:hypothetical protein
VNYKWKGSRDGQEIYSAYIDGIKFCWSYDSGTGNPEKAGSGSLLVRHFFKERHQNNFREVFGEDQFLEICSELNAAYKDFLSKQNIE